LSPPDESELRVLVLAPVGRDAALVGETLREAGIACRVCPDLVALRVEMQEGAGAIVVTEDLLRPEAIAELGELFAGQLAWSDLPLLIFSAGRDGQGGPLEELKKLAAYTLIDRPTRKKTLISAVQTALRARRRQYEVRDLLGELEKTVRSRDQFLAMLSHELRNPLAAILTAGQLMERRDPSAFVSERAIVQRQARLLARLVDDLLDVSRVTLGKIALAPGLVDMGALLERCVKSWLSAAGDFGVALTLQPLPASFAVDGDPVRLEQIVSNLLSNAVKYTPRGGHVTVAVELDGDSGRIRVADDGVGIDAGALPSIFELFSQDDQTLDRSRGGLGVGLTLVRSLVALHGGTVTATSAGRGKGSEFVVQLPRVAAPGGTAAAGEEATPAAAAPQTILVIDDNSDIRAGLSELLRFSGHEVLESARGEEGIELALERRPQAVLIDIGLPGLDGYSVARRLRQELGDAVRLVALTGYGSAQDRRRSFEAGFDEHITKPTTFAVLMHVLSTTRPAAAPRVSRPAAASNS
jgi:signal transduction histidine kinase/ActR/RegA family two-component response regulator